MFILNSNKKDERQEQSGQPLLGKNNFISTITSNAKYTTVFYGFEN